MNALEAVAIVGSSGAVGGLTAYLATGGLRKKLVVKDGPSETGFIATMVIGAVAAAVAWAAQAPRESLILTAKLSEGQVPNLGDIVAAVGIGLAGAQWLAKNYQANFFKFAGSRAALSEPDGSVAVSIATGDRKAVATKLRLR